MITTSESDKEIVNKPTYANYLSSRYGRHSKDGKTTEIDTSNFIDSFLRDNIVYLVEYTPEDVKRKKVYGGLVSINDKLYNFDIFLGNNEYSDEVYETSIAVLAELK